MLNPEQILKQVLKEIQDTERSIAKGYPNIMLAGVTLNAQEYLNHLQKTAERLKARTQKIT